MKWTAGRQGSGYYKKLLAHGKTWDFYLLKYPPGSQIPEHTDIVSKKIHQRLNFLLWGEDACRYQDMGPHLEPKKWWRFTLFRPDLVPHRVLRIKSTRYVLSVGWVK